MIFIIGGAYSGKTEYAVSMGIDRKKITDGKDMNTEKINGIVCIKNYHLLIKRLLEYGDDPMDFTKIILEKNKDIVIISDEIGNGIIPLEKNDRIWREETGRVCCYIAQTADRVIRLVCGMAQVIK